MPKVREVVRIRNEKLIAEGYSLKCEICGFISPLSLISHICRIHKISMQEYRTKFPNSKVQQSTKETNENISKRMKQFVKNCPEKFAKFQFPLPCTKEHWIRKGFSEEEAIEKVSKFQSEMSKRCWENEETRKKFSENNSGQNNPMSLSSIMKRFNVDEDVAKTLTPCFGRCKEKHPMFGKHHSIEALEKIAAAWHLSEPSWRSSGEIELNEFCNSICKNVSSNKKISRYNVDIILDDKLIIEYFGDFWHMNPKKFLENDINKVLKIPSKTIWDRDKRKIEYLKNLGYDVLIIWESSWKKDRSLQEKEIKDAYDNIQRS